MLGGAVGHSPGPTIALPNSGYDLPSAADRVVAAARLWRSREIDRLVLAGGSEDTSRAKPR